MWVPFVEARPDPTQRLPPLAAECGTSKYCMAVRGIGRSPSPAATFLELLARAAGAGVVAADFRRDRRLGRKIVGQDNSLQAALAAVQDFDEIRDEGRGVGGEVAELAQILVLLLGQCAAKAGEGREQAHQAHHRGSDILVFGRDHRLPMIAIEGESAAEAEQPELPGGLAVIGELVDRREDGAAFQQLAGDLRLAVLKQAGEALAVGRIGKAGVRAGAKAGQP